MIKAASEGESVQYTTYKDLQEPELQSLGVNAILEDLSSKEWKKNFEALTHLRQANRYYGNILLQELLPQLHRSIIGQVDNLRSNNSKEAITLLSQILEHQNIQKLDKSVICPLISSLFTKTVSQKSFIKKQALAGIQTLPKKYNPFLMQQIANHTLSLNAQISELAARILVQYIENNKITEFSGEFMSTLIRTIHGKRAVLQKKGKQIINNLKQRLGEERLNQLIQQAFKQLKISEDEHRLLLQQVKKQEKQIKTQQSLKDYISLKKKSESF